MTPTNPAPNFTIPSVTGEQIQLSQVLENGNNALLIFLRHLGCIPCREHVVALSAYQNELRDYKTRVFIISFATLPNVQEWVNQTCATFTVLLDRERTAYNAYGLERSFLRSRSLKTRWYYLKAWLAGKPTYNSHGDDTTQLGGDFIVDKNGILRFSYPSQDPVDRPPVGDLLKALQKLP